jgi:hypothetical protein
MYCICRPVAFKSTYINTSLKSQTADPTLPTFVEHGVEQSSQHVQSLPDLTSQGYVEQQIQTVNCNVHNCSDEESKENLVFCGPNAVAGEDGNSAGDECY